jgi:hypothetical protein
MQEFPSWDTSSKLYFSCENRSNIAHVSKRTLEVEPFLHSMITISLLGMVKRPIFLLTSLGYKVGRTLPETGLFPTAQNLQEVGKNRQGNNYCRLTHRKIPPG